MGSKNAQNAHDTSTYRAMKMAEMLSGLWLLPFVHFYINFSLKSVFWKKLLLKCTKSTRRQQR